MKILAFTDIHGSINKTYVSVEQTMKRLELFKKAIKKEKVDLAVCCGDFTHFNQHMKFLLGKIAQLEIPVLIIPGNHEDELELSILVKRYKNIKYIHKKSHIIGKYAFVGYGGDGFSRRNPDFVKTMKRLTPKLKNKKIILITHGPAYGTKVDYLPGCGHVGNVDFREFVEKNKNVILALSGHIHEAFEKRQQIKQALVMNPGPTGKIIEFE